MSQPMIVNKRQLLATAGVFGAIGVFTGPPLALAGPFVPPLAPPCSQYQFNGDYAIDQSNGYRVLFSSTGPVASGPATANPNSGGGVMTGNVSGGIQGSQIDFTIRWDNGAQGRYKGFVDSDGFSHGTTTDEGTGNSANWNSVFPSIGCATPAQAPPPAAQQGPPMPLPQPTTATVITDVDVYDAPGGDGNVIGMLPAGSHVQPVGSCYPNDWCQVIGDAVPTKQGWVWGNLQF